MFAEMRAALGGIPKSVDILEHVYSLPTAEAQEAGMKAIRDIERRNMVFQPLDLLHTYSPSPPCRPQPLY